MANKTGIDPLGSKGLKPNIFNIIFLVALSFVTLYLVSPFEFQELHPLIKEANKAILGFLMVLGLLLLLVIRIILFKNMIRLNTVDVLFLAYIVYLLFYGMVLRPIPVDPFYIVDRFLFVLLYICYRNVHINLVGFIWLSFVVGAFLQIYYGVSIQTHWFAPGYSLKDIYGSFVNQGTFASALVCIFIIVFGAYLDYRKKKLAQKSIIKWVTTSLFFVFLSFLIIVIVYSNSRASWLALLAGVFLLLVQNYQGIKACNLLNSKRKKILSLSILLIIVIGMGTSLYLYKQDSAQGRFLIWKVGLEMFYESPFIGHGINSFGSKYMNYQAHYFESKPTDHNRYLAADNRFAFNEFLRIAIEQGILGFVVLILVIYYFLRHIRIGMLHKKDGLRSISFAALFSISIFGLFSYPMEILPIKTMAISFIAVLSGGCSNAIFEVPAKESSESQKGAMKALLASIFVGTTICGNSILKFNNATKAWNCALIELGNGNSFKYILYGENNYELLKGNGDFLALYGKSLLQAKQYFKAIEILKEAKQLAPSTAILIDLGKAYFSIGRYDEAEYYWYIASKMVPSLFYPEYLIAEMYWKRGQKEKARKIAKDLLNNKKIKVHSVEVYYIIEDLKKIAQDL